MKLLAQLVPPPPPFVWRGLLSVLLALTAAHGGPMSFAELDQLPKAEPFADCGSCAFVTSFEPLPPPNHTDEVLLTVGFLMILAVVGWLGVRVRVRVKRNR